MKLKKPFNVQVLLNPMPYMLVIGMFFLLTWQHFYYYPAGSELISSPIERDSQQLVDLRNGEFFLQNKGSLKATGTLLVNEWTHLMVPISLRSGDGEQSIHLKVFKNERLSEDFTLKALGREQWMSFLVKPGDRLRFLATAKTESPWELVFELKHINFIHALALLLLLAVWLKLVINLKKQEQLSLGLGFYLLFAQAILIHLMLLGDIPFSNVIFYGAVAIMLVLAGIHIRDFKAKCIFVLFYFFTLGSLIYYWLGVSPELQNSSIINRHFKTSFPESESIDFTNFYFFIMALSSSVLMLWWLKLKPNKKKHVNAGLFLITCLLIALSAPRINDLPLPFKDEFEPELLQALNSSKKIQFVKEGENELYVLVLGSEIHKNNLSLYDYSRDTTPHLKGLWKNQELLRFEQAFSNHVRSDLSLSFALSSLSQEQTVNLKEVTSLLSVFKQAGFETAWINVNEENYNSFIVNTFSKEADVKFSELSQMQFWLKENNPPNRLAVIYVKPEFDCEKISLATKPSPEVFSKMVLDEQVSQRVQCYDDGIVRQDAMMASLVETLKATDKKATLIYSSDVALEVFFHRTSNQPAQFDFEMTQIPLVIFANHAFKEAYPEKWKNLENHQKYLFSNDRLYDTQIGLAGIKAHNEVSERDLSSSHYALAPDKAVTLHGQLAYTTPDNEIYWQRRNAHELQDQNRGGKLFPHRVNSIEKLKDIWRAGFRAFEVDLLFDASKKRFFVGHGSGVMGTELEIFLSQVPTDEIQRMWFDFKNLNESNYQNVLAEFERLDQKFGLKNRILLESPWVDHRYSLFREAGWQTSFYLPRRAIVEASRRKDLEELQKLAKEISAQVNAQNTHAVSFEYQCYPFVKIYLEPLLKDQVYHIWGTSNLSRGPFIDGLDDSVFILDKRVSALIGGFSSRFTL